MERERERKREIFTFASNTHYKGKLFTPPPSFLSSNSVDATFDKTTALQFPQQQQQLFLQYTYIEGERGSILSQEIVPGGRRNCSEKARLLGNCSECRQCHYSTAIIF